MEFKTGDRVHVTRLDGEKVDFYATLSGFASHNKAADLVNCTDSSFEGAGVYLPDDVYFGPDKNDYYTLATDEENTEEPVIEHDELIKDVEKLREELKHLRIETDEYFEFWQEESRKYETLTEHIRLKALHNPSVSRYKDLVCFINEMEGK